MALDIRINKNPEKQDPGYIFVAPYSDGDTGFLGGPHIFQSDGVSASHEVLGKKRANLSRLLFGKAMTE